MIPVYANAISEPDKNILYPLPINFNPQWNYQGRTQALPYLTAGEHTTVIITYGDSLAASTDNSAYTVINTGKVLDFSIENGGAYQAKTPAFGCSDEGVPASNGFWGHRLGDKLINGGYTQKVFMCNLGIGSTGTTDWATTQYNRRFAVLYNRLVQTGLINADVVLILSSLGGLDQILAVPSATVTANYLTIWSAIRAAGFTTQRIYPALSSWGGGGTGGVNGTNVRTGIQNAVAAATNVYLGPDTDVIPITSRYDSNHFKAVGSDQDATLWLNTIKGLF